MGCCASVQLDQANAARQAEVDEVASRLQAQDGERIAQILSGPDADMKEESNESSKQAAVESGTKNCKEEVSQYMDIEGTRLEDLLRHQCMAVVCKAYFDGCWSKGVRFEDRALIAAEGDGEGLINGETVVEQWRKCGAGFLNIISYAWLHKDHPDPEKFHLPRLVRVLKELLDWHKWEDRHGRRIAPPDLGVILDYCSLWQRGAGNADKRTPHQLQQFKEALQEINTPYAHAEVVAIKLMAVPESVCRKYDNRGWTLFESTIIDGKQLSPILQESNVGELNALCFDDSFDYRPATEQSGYDFLRETGKSSTSGGAALTPPLTPARFGEELKLRAELAREKHVDLFTSGKDQPFVKDKYKDAFEELIKAKAMKFCDRETWGHVQWLQVAEVICQCQSMKTLDLDRNDMGDDGAKAIATGLPGSKIEDLDLSHNHIGDEGANAIANNLPLTQIKGLKLIRNRIGDEGAKSIANTLPQTQIEMLQLGGNQIGTEGANAIADVLAQSKVTALKLRGNVNIGFEAKDRLREICEEKTIDLLVD